MKVRIALLALLSAPALANAAVVPITLADFVNPAVLDFESAPLGNISGTAPLFTNFGISSVTAAGSAFFDPYDVRPNSSRALWQNASGLAVVDPGAPNLALVGVSYTIDFQNDHTKFGVGVHDQAATTFTYSFFNNNVLVGSGVFITDITADLNMAFFESSVPFDRVTISDNNAGGFALDNITLDGVAAAAPEPASLALLGIALGGLGWGYRRKST